MANKKCSGDLTDGYSILIPYKDFVKIAEMASQVDELNAKYDRLVQMYDAMKSMYSEALDKIAEINRYL